MPLEWFDCKQRWSNTDKQSLAQLWILDKIETWYSQKQDTLIPYPSWRIMERKEYSVFTSAGDLAQWYDLCICLSRLVFSMYCITKERTNISDGHCELYFICAFDKGPWQPLLGYSNMCRCLHYHLCVTLPHYCLPRGLRDNTILSNTVMGEEKMRGRIHASRYTSVW